jgi:hypothetical protein
MILLPGLARGLQTLVLTFAAVRHCACSLLLTAAVLSQLDNRSQPHSVVEGDLFARAI